MKNYYGIKTLATKYAEKGEISVKEAETRIKDMIEVITDALADKDFDGIQFIGNFTLKKIQRKERVGRNPKTQETFVIPERVGVKLDVSKGLAERINA